MGSACRSILPLGSNGSDSSHTKYDGTMNSGNMPVKVVFGLSGMGVAPAGMDEINTGHHHLLVDTALPDFNTPIPSDDRYRHFGGGQTEVVIELAPGEHTLQLLFADYTHSPHIPPVVSEQITITVR